MLRETYVSRASHLSSLYPLRPPSPHRINVSLSYAFMPRSRLFSPAPSARFTLTLHVGARVCKPHANGIFPRNARFLAIFWRSDDDGVETRQRPGNGEITARARARAKASSSPGDAAWLIVTHDSVRIRGSNRLDPAVIPGRIGRERRKYMCKLYVGQSREIGGFERRNAPSASYVT